jgi:hypothetical protein
MCVRSRSPGSPRPVRWSHRRRLGSHGLSTASRKVRSTSTDSSPVPALPAAWSGSWCWSSTPPALISPTMNPHSVMTSATRRTKPTPASIGGLRGSGARTSSRPGRYPHRFTGFSGHDGVMTWLNHNEVVAREPLLPQGGGGPSTQAHIHGDRPPRTTTVDSAAVRAAGSGSTGSSPDDFDPESPAYRHAGSTVTVNRTRLSARHVSWSLILRWSVSELARRTSPHAWKGVAG